MCGAKEGSLGRGTVRCARASSVRWVRTRGEGSGVFQLSGMTWARRVHRAGWESGGLALSREGTDLHRCAEAGLMVVGEEMSLRAAIRLLWERSTESGGRQNSVARIGVGVERKQLVTYLCT